MLTSTPPLAFLSLRLWSPALVPSVLQQFVVCSPLLIFNYANKTLFSLVKVSHLYWILLLVPSSLPSAIDKFGLAVAKASVMRLLGVPLLPLPPPVPRAALARNCPEPADSFPPPLPLTYASSLSFILPSSSLSLSPASSP